jgi:hypothetical protein
MQLAGVLRNTPLSAFRCHGMPAALATRIRSTLQRRAVITSAEWHAPRVLSWWVALARCARKMAVAKGPPRWTTFGLWEPRHYDVALPLAGAAAVQSMANRP